MEEPGAGYCPWGRKESDMTERLHLLTYLWPCPLMPVIFIPHQSWHWNTSPDTAKYPLQGKLFLMKMTSTSFNLRDPPVECPVCAWLPNTNISSLQNIQPGLLLFFKDCSSCGPFLSVYWICYNIASVLRLLLFFFFAHEACGLLALQPGMETTPPALEDTVLTSGLPWKS